MKTVSFATAAILSYLEKRKDLSPFQRKTLQAASDGEKLPDDILKQILEDVRAEYRRGL